jgi:hypothetical protein
LKQDIRNSFELAEDLKGTLENRYDRDFERHRPCFVILAPLEYGLLFVLLRGGKSYTDDERTEWEVAYDARAGILIENPVVSWPNLEEAVDANHGGPITQEQTTVTSVTVGDEEHELREVYPLDQEATGDADIIAARNPFSDASLRTEAESIEEAVENTQHLTFRVRGGTIGFENEARYTVNSMTVHKPEALSFWGFPVPICSPSCTAHPSD